MDYVYVLAGLVLLFIGGEGLIRGSVSISKRLGISAILIGMVVVGFGTSTPELLVSVQASFKGQPDIALGNVIGSNIANVLLILGLSAIISPVVCQDKALRRDSLAVVAASVVLFVLSFLEVISRMGGAVMIFVLAGYLYYAYRAERREKKARLQNEAESVHEREAEEYEETLGLPVSIGLCIGGIAMLVFGADLLVEGASDIARDYGISEAVIGLSLVAVGTSLPELAAGIAASLKKHSDVVIGNILGSNLFNILFILGVTAIIKPIPVSGQMVVVDIPVMLTVAVGLFGIIFVLKNFGRVSGVLSLLAYTAYITWLYMGGDIAI